MLTDSYGQSVPYPALTDKANAQSMGEGIVEGIVPRSVMRFPSRNVRGGTIANPRAGMTTWISDEAVLEVFDGHEWAVVAAGSSKWKNLVLRSGYSTEDNNSQGTPAYRIVNLFGEPTIMFRGGVHITYLSNNNAPGDGWFATLPELDCPGNLRSITVASSVAGSSERTSVKLDVNPAGGPNAQQLKFVGVNGADAKPPWVSLNGAFCSL